MLQVLQVLQEGLRPPYMPPPQASEQPARTDLRPLQQRTSQGHLLQQLDRSSSAIRPDRRRGSPPAHCRPILPCEQAPASPLQRRRRPPRNCSGCCRRWRRPPGARATTAARLFQLGGDVWAPGVSAPGERRRGGPPSLAHAGRIALAPPRVPARLHDMSSCLFCHPRSVGAALVPPQPPYRIAALPPPSPLFFPCPAWTVRAQAGMAPAAGPASPPDSE